MHLIRTVQMVSAGCVDTLFHKFICQFSNKDDCVFFTLNAPVSGCVSGCALLSCSRVKKKNHNIQILLLQSYLFLPYVTGNATLDNMKSQVKVDQHHFF